MTSQLLVETGSKPQKSVSTPGIKLLTPKDAAELLKVSASWLAKARMRGDGPAFIRIGRSIRYAELALLQWMKPTSTCPQANDRRDPLSRLLNPQNRGMQVHSRTSVSIAKYAEEW